MKTYKRVLVTGSLTCLSDLHIGDGDLTLQSERDVPPSAPRAESKRTTDNSNRAKVLFRPPETEKKEEKKSEGSYNTVCRDYQNRAYIPGSTLRGSLASFLNRETSFYRKFFGYADEEAKNTLAARQAGLLRVYDARLQEETKQAEKFSDLPGFSEERHTFLRHSVSISPITGTAAKGKLFCYELVPKGSIFTVQFQIESRNKAGAEKFTKEELAQLLALIKQWNTEAAAIGSGVTKGYGRIQWKMERVEALTSKEELHWLESDSLEPPPMMSITDTAQPADINALLSEAGSDGGKDTAPLKFKLDILPDGPFLINEPEYVQDKSKQGEKEVFPVLEYSRGGRNGKKSEALIPARTLAGAIRGRARRILATIAHQHYDVSEDTATGIAESVVKDFFGLEERKGALRLTEARGEAEQHIQNFIGVDRFTGGVNDGANYKVRAAACKKLSTEDCLLDRHLLPAGDWWKGMLLLVLLDGMDGDMQVGWGKAKGYGRMAFQLQYNGKIFADRKKLLDEIKEVIGTETAKKWVQALHDRIQRNVKVNEAAATGGQA